MGTLLTDDEIAKLDKINFQADEDDMISLVAWTNDLASLEIAKNVASEMFKILKDQIADLTVSASTHGKGAGVFLTNA